MENLNIDVLLSTQKYEWVSAKHQRNWNEWKVLTSNGVPSHPGGGGESNPSRTLCFPLLAVTKGNSPRKTLDLYWYQTRALDWPTTRRFVQQKAPVKSSSLPQHPLNHHSPITLPDKTRAATGSPGESHKCWSVWERDLRFIELRFGLMTPIMKRYILVGRGSDLKSHKFYKEKEV